MNNEIGTPETDVTIFHVEGDIVAAKVGTLRAELRGLVAAGTRRLTLDLAATEMLDSAGIGLLISAHNSLRKSGGELAVVNVTAPVADLLRAMRIHQHFRVSGAGDQKGL